ncbi:MAG: hypothetical protein HPY50_05910 [Firmicutes bacterium]|nr:hypothetical protein [Bacillota bacterium]
MKTWYIEDAGGGCRAFSEVLVLVCEEPQLVYSSQVPLTWDDGTTIEQLACQLVKEMMRKAGVTREDYLLVCSGNIFHELHRTLTEENYRWDYHKMDGLAHEIAEETFYQQMLEAGFPAFVRPSDHNYRLFYSFVEHWIAQQPERQRYLKDRVCRAKPLELHYLLRSNGHRRQFCQKCRQNIDPYTPMVEYQYKNNGSRRRSFFHPECTPVAPGKNKLKLQKITFQGEEVEAVIKATRKEGLVCSRCEKPLPPEVDALYWYGPDKKLYVGHLVCIGTEPEE